MRYMRCVSETLDGMIEERMSANGRNGMPLMTSATRMSTISSTPPK